MYKYVVKLNNLKFNATHGLYEYERNHPQEFELDIKFSYYENNSCNDNMKESINYETLYDIAKGVVTSNTFNLIESIGEKIIEDIFKYYDNACSVKVVIRKPEVKFDDNSNCVEVSVFKSNGAPKYFFFIACIFSIKKIPVDLHKHCTIRIT